MARIDYPDVAAADPQLLADILAQRGGKLTNLYRMLLHSPPVARGWLHLLTAIRQQSYLEGRFREMVIMRIALVNEADYEYAQHIPFALAAGLSEQEFTALHDWRAYTGWSPVDAAVLAYTDSITRDIQVPDEVFSAVREHFSERELVELTVAIAGYNLVSRFLEALAIDHE